MNLLSMMYCAYSVIVALIFISGCESVTLRAPLQDCHTFAGCNINGTVKCQHDNTTGTNTCMCYPGYKNPTCDDRDECSSGHNICTNGICVNTIGAYRCDCLPGLIGTHCNHNDTSTNCSLGYRDDRGNCTDVDECTFSSVSPCWRGTCINTAGSYACTCPPGWTGHRCNVDIDECGSSPCFHGQCTNQMNSFTCSCDPFWTGTLCDVPLTTTGSITNTTTIFRGSPSAVTLSSQTHTQTPTVTNVVRSSTDATHTQTPTVTNVVRNSTDATHTQTPTVTNVVRSSTDATHTQSPTVTNVVRSSTDASMTTQLSTLKATTRHSHIQHPAGPEPDHHEDSTNVGLIAGIAAGGVMVVAGGVVISMLLYHFVIKRRQQVRSQFPEEDTVIEVEQQASSTNPEQDGVKVGHNVVGLPIDREYAMRTRFSIKRLLRQ